MWGTIAKMRVRPDVPQQYLVGQLAALNRERMEGWLHTTFFQSDTDPNEYWMVAMFESREAYLRNAESRAQHQVYLTLRSMMVDDPEWHDVAEVRTLEAP